MVGREMTDRYPKREPHLGETIFEVKDWVVYHPIQVDRKVIKSIDLNVRKGEMVGIAGFMGSGTDRVRDERVWRAYGRRITGEVRLHGKAVDVSTIGKAVKSGIAYVTEDRKTFGLNLIDHIKHNTTLANLEGVSRRP